MPEHICACCLMDLDHAIAFRERCIKTHLLLLKWKKRIAPADGRQTLLDCLDEIDPLNSPDLDTFGKDEVSETLGQEDGISDDLDGIENSDGFVQGEVLSDSLSEDDSDNSDLYKAIESSLSDKHTAPPIPSDSSSTKKSIQQPLSSSIASKNSIVRAHTRNAIVLARPQPGTSVSTSSRIARPQPAPVTTTISSHLSQKTRPVNKSRTSNSGHKQNGQKTIKPLNIAKPPSINDDTPLRSYVCDQCGRTFSDGSNLKVHLLRHTGVKNFECEQCGNKYFTHHLLNLHIRVRHKGEMPYACKFCDQRFYTSTSRCRHERIHQNKRPFVCKYCGKAFLTKSCVNKHEFIHSGQRPYRCEICDVGFPRNTNLRIHFRSQAHQKKAKEDAEGQDDVQMDNLEGEAGTNNEPTSENNTEGAGQPNSSSKKSKSKPKAEPKKRNYHRVCDYCGHAFRSAHNYKMHVLRHTGEKPFSCNLCERKFYANYYLQMHIRTVHEGISPYPCRYENCGKKFNDASTRRCHERIHSQQYPYRCLYCNKGFNKSKQCTDHQSTHTGEIPLT
ncbi:zinc finger protein 235-like isoform X2 [Scaptodrosophila lebanonensis]|nr:zinc finger protein 235-like isoform X2 [Scaptodrosophila lebanonensis]